MHQTAGLVGHNEQESVGMEVRSHQVRLQQFEIPLGTGEKKQEALQEKLKCLQR